MAAKVVKVLERPRLKLRSWAETSDNFVVAWSEAESRRQVVIDNTVFIVGRDAAGAGQWCGVSRPCGNGAVQAIVRASGKVDGTR